MLLTSCHSAYCGLQRARRPSVFGCAHISNRRTPATQGAWHSARRRVQQHRKQTVCAAGAAIKDPYKVLGIPSSADTQAIKRAFKKKAKELHPDVNHAADASTRFMEVKMAYQLLTDTQKRQQYDRQQEAGFDWGDFVDGIANGGRKKPKKADEEPFYSFTDFLKDLDTDLKKWSDQVNSKGFKSLFEELYDAGLIAVNQLEKQLGLDKDAARPSTSSSSTSTASSTRASSTQEPARDTTQPQRQTAEEESEAIRRRVQAFEAEAAQKKKQAEQEVDDMLADLKKRLQDR